MILPKFLVAVASLVLAAASEASIVVTLEQIGGDVKFSYTGSLDLTGLTVSTMKGAAMAAANPQRGEICFNAAVYARNNIYAGALTSGGGGFGLGAYTEIYPQAGTTSGDLLQFRLVPSAGWPDNGSPWVSLRDDYVSGTTISGYVTFTETTYAALGINPSQFNSVLTLVNGQTLTLTTAVPEPASCAFIGGFGVLFAVAVRRRRLAAT